jgi:Ycf4.
MDNVDILLNLTFFMQKNCSLSSPVLHTDNLFFSLIIKYENTYLEFSGIFEYIFFTQSIRIQVKEGLFPRRILYMEIRGQGAIPLTRTDEKFFTPREIEQKAAELAYLLRIPMEVF